MRAQHVSTSRRAGAAADHQINRMFRALSDPTRRAVIAHLARSPASVTDLARPFKMALPSFAQHLTVLEECGVVRSHKEGRIRRYQLVPQPLVVAEDWMTAQRVIWGQRLDRLAEYVEGMKDER